MNSQDPELRYDIIGDTTIAITFPDTYTKLHIFWKDQLLKLDLQGKHDDK